MATAARPRLIENNHVDVKNIRRVCAEGLDNGTFCQRNRIRREKDGGSMHKRPKWDDCQIFWMYSKSQSKFWHVGQEGRHTSVMIWIS